ncbi:hypothetical protein, partial [Corynebacterium ulcerans]
MKYWQVDQQFRWRTEHLSIFCENVDGWYFERESWSFEGGTDAPLEFEEASNYSNRLKKERFNPNIMLSYLGFLGINLQDLNFYQGRMTVLVGQ